MCAGNICLILPLSGGEIPPRTAYSHLIPANRGSAFKHPITPLLDRAQACHKFTTGAAPLSWVSLGA